ETDAAKETERREPALALVDGLQPERIAGTDLQLALDRLGARPHVADDQHVVDEDLRAFLHGVGHRDVRVVLAESRSRLDGRVRIAAIVVHRLNRLAIDCELARDERTAGCQSNPRAELRLPDGAIAFEPDAVHDGASAFV